MKMTDLAMTKKQRKEYYSGPVPESKDDGPRYPYGLCISLDRDTLSKMGYDADNLPDAGCSVTVQGKGYIRSTRIEQREKDEDSLGLELQLTDLGFEEDGKSRKDRKRSEQIDALSKSSK